MTPKDLKNIIQDRLRAYLYNYLGKTPETEAEKDEFRRLARNGLIKKDRIDALKTLFALGKASALGLGEKSGRSYVIVKDWGKAEVSSFINSTMGSLTRIEQASLDFIRAETESRLEALFETIGATIQNNYRNRILGGEDFTQVVRQSLERRIKDRKTIRQLASDIGRQTGAWGRDLYRIAFTESHSAYNFGAVFGYMKKTGKKADDINVAVIPRGRGISCPDCVRLYLKPGTDEPKIFKLSQIIGNSNVKRKRREWLPCVSSTHPYCSCLVFVIFSGMVWNNDKKRFEYPSNK